MNGENSNLILPTDPALYQWEEGGAQPRLAVNQTRLLAFRCSPGLVGGGTLSPSVVNEKMDRSDV